MDTNEDLPLAGVKVLELAQMIAAPAAGLLLADYGAEVIKIEPPSGDSCRQLKSPAARDQAVAPVFTGYNRNKRLVREDLQDAEARDRVLRLIDEADILIESSRPGVMDRLGLGAEAALRRNPKLIYASVSGFGTGPVGRQLGGVDIVVQAESGVMSTTGFPDGPPVKVGFTIIDAACGHALCHGILAALLRRARTGRGDIVRISLYDVALHLQTGPLCEFLATGQQSPRPGNTAPLSAPADAFRCKDGFAIISAYLQPHWERFAHLIGAPELTGNPLYATGGQRAANRSTLTPLIEAKLSTATASEWVDRVRAAGLLAGLVKDYAAVADAALTAESGMLTMAGTAPAVRSPVRLQHTRATTPSAAVVEEASGGEAVRFATGATAP